MHTSIQQQIANLHQMTVRELRHPPVRIHLAPLDRHPMEAVPRHRREAARRELILVRAAAEVIRAVRVAAERPVHQGAARAAVVPHLQNPANRRHRFPADGGRAAIRLPSIHLQEIKHARVLDRVP